MPIEISYLVASVILFLVMILAQSVGAILSGRSVTDLVGARDDLPVAGYSAFHGRAKRAQANMIEGMMMFVPAVLVAAHMDAFNSITALGAALFFWGRLAFAPCYWFGIAWVRTLVWAVSIIGIVMVVSQILPFGLGG